MPAGRLYKYNRRKQTFPKRRKNHGKTTYAKYRKTYPKKSKFTKPTHAVIKCNRLSGYDDVSLFGTSSMQGSSDPIEWHMIHPLHLTRVSNAAPNDNARQSNTINARNCSVKFEVFPSKRLIQNFQIRICYGYWTGDAAAGTSQLTADMLKTIYPHINDTLFDRDTPAKQDFKWKYTRTYTLTPRQIYDEDTEEGDHAGADRTLVANWTPRRFKVNFKFNRRHTYANADADSLNGWQPIIAIQCKACPGGNQFTRPTVPGGADYGNYPGPRMSIASSTYFNDVR